MILGYSTNAFKKFPLFEAIKRITGLELYPYVVQHNFFIFPLKTESDFPLRGKNRVLKKNVFAAPAPFSSKKKGLKDVKNFLSICFLKVFSKIFLYPARYCTDGVKHE